MRAAFSFTLGQSWRLAAFLIVLGLGKRAGAAEPPCPLIPEFRALAADCRRDPAPEDCRWVPIVETLARNDLEPSYRQIGAPLELPRGADGTVFLMAADLTTELSEPTCRAARVGRLLQALDEPFWREGISSEGGFLLFYQLEEWSSNLSMVEKEIAPRDLPFLRAAAGSYRSLSSKLGRDSFSEKWSRAYGGQFGRTGGQLGLEPDEKFEDGDLRELALALRQFSEGRPKQGRRDLDRLCDARPPRLALRAGFILATGGWLEDAERVLRKAQESLEAGPLKSAESRYLVVIAIWLRAGVLREMGLTDEADRIWAGASVFEDPVITALVRALGLPGSRPVASFSWGLDHRALAEAESASRLAGTHSALLRAYAAISPRPKAKVGPALGESAVTLALRVVSALEAGDLEAGEKAAETLVTIYPRYENSRYLVSIARSYLDGDRREDALRVARRPLDALEEQSEPYQLEETAQSFIGTRVDGAFSFAVDLAAWLGSGATAFEFAERGRAYSLRRRLVQARRATEGEASEDERRLEAAIRAEGSGSGRDRFLLGRLYREFEQARFARRLIGVDGDAADPVEPPIPTLAALQASLAEHCAPSLPLARARGVYAPPEGRSMRAAAIVAASLAMLADVGLAAASPGLGQGPVFIPELMRVAAACRLSAAPPDHCLWLPILQAHGEGRDPAPEIAAAFGLSAATARQVQTAAKLYGPTLIARFTDRAALARYLEAVKLDRAELHEPNFLVLQSFVLGQPEFFRVVIEARTPPAEWLGVRRAGSSLRDLWAATGLLPALRHFLVSDAADFPPAGPLPAANLAEDRLLIEALEPFTRGEVAAGREGLFRLLAHERPQLAIRAARGLQRLLFLEDAAELLRRVAIRLATADPADGERRCLLIIARWNRARVLHDLGLRDAAEAELAAVRRAADPLAEKLLAALGSPESPPADTAHLIDLHGFGTLALAAEQQGRLRDLAAAWEAMSDAALPPRARSLLEEVKGIAASFLSRFFGKPGRPLAASPALAADRAGLADRLRRLAILRPQDEDLPTLTMLAAFGLVRDEAPAPALELAELAVATTEKQLLALRLDESRASFLDRRTPAGDVFSFAVDLAAFFGSDHGRQALEFAERGRADTLRRLLGAPRDPAAAEERSAEEIAILGRLKNLGRDAAGEQRRELQRRFAAARWQRRLAAAPKVAMPLAPAPPGEEEVRRGELVLSYFQSAEPRGLFRLPPAEEIPDPFRGQLWLWGLDDAFLDLRATGSRATDWSRLACWLQLLRWADTSPVQREWARRRGGDFLSEASCAGSGDPASQLYQLLVAPAETRLPGHPRLVIVPHGRLHAIPFAALRGPGGRCLIEDFEIVVAPSLDTLAMLRRRGRAAAGHRHDDNPGRPAPPAVSPTR